MSCAMLPSALSSPSPQNKTRVPASQVSTERRHATSCATRFRRREAITCPCSTSRALAKVRLGYTPQQTAALPCLPPPPPTQSSRETFTTKKNLPLQQSAAKSSWQAHSLASLHQSSTETTHKEPPGLPIHPAVAMSHSAGLYPTLEPTFLRVETAGGRQRVDSPRCHDSRTPPSSMRGPRKGRLPPQAPLPPSLSRVSLGVWRRRRKTFIVRIRKLPADVFLTQL